MPLATLLLVVVGYLIAFYAVEPVRLKYCATLVLPDQVWDDWTAGGWPHVLDRLPIWLLMAYYLGAANCAGRMVLRVMRPKELSQLERLVFSMSLGLAILSTITLIIGLAGGLHWPWVFRIGSATLIFAELAFSFRVPHSTLRADWSAELGARSAELRKPHPSLVIGHWSLVILSSLYFLAGVLPPTDFDVLEYHLQVPKEWFQAGQIGFLPHNVYGNMPLGAEMHALACMELWLGSDAWWHGALAGKVIISSFTPLTAMALYSAARRWFSQPVGVVAAAVYLTFPWIAHVSFNGLVDSVLAHYTFVAIYAAMLAGTDWRKQLLTGLLAGAAAACKYPGLVFAGVPVLAILLGNVWAQSLQKKAASTALALGCALAGLACVAGPWYAKNAALTGNPVYPLAANILDGRTRTPERISQWNRAHRVPQDEDGNRYSVAGWWLAKKSVGLASQWLSPIAWPLAIVGLLATWRKRAVQVLAATAAWIFAVWFLATHRIDRFWLPATPLLCLVAGTAWEWSGNPAYRRLTAAVAAVGVLAAMLMLIAPTYVNDRPVTISNPHWLTSLERLRTEGPTPSHQQLNKVAQQGEAALLVGDATPFDLTMPVYYNTCFDECIFETLTKNRSPEEVLTALRERRIAYVLVDWSEIARYRSPGNYGFTDYVRPEVFKRLVGQSVLGPPQWLGEEGSWEIYRVE